MSRARTSFPPRGSAGGVRGASERLLRRFLPKDDIESALQRVFAPHLAPRGGERALRSLQRRWAKTLRDLRPLGGLSFGNRVRLLADGDAAFEAMWKALGSARQSVRAITYILEPDRVGRRTLDELLRAAERGCDVLLVYDGFGSSNLGAEELEPLRRAGARVVVFNPLSKLPFLHGRLERNHRKILVVDDRLSFCGGMNVSEDYAGPQHGGNLFLDAHLEIQGPAARDLATLVLDAARADVALVRAPHVHGAVAPAQDGSLVQVLESSIRRDRRTIQRALRLTLSRASKRVFLTTPYFVPPQRLLRALCRAAARGVDVRVMTAGRSDVPVVHLASQHLYGRLLRAGVKIYEVEGRVLHAKTFAADGVYASVGSFNLDTWSDRRNLEVSVTVLDASLAAEIEGDFEARLALSREVCLETWRRRTWFQCALHWAAYQLMRI